MTEQLLVYKKSIKVKPSAELWSRLNTEIYDVENQAASFTRFGIDQSEFSLWRYRQALPFDENSEIWREVSLGEGGTGLVSASDDWPGLKLKLEYAMPTSSFKDRGAAVMFAKLKEWGIDRVAADSSGNAGTAIAAYAARTGIKCDVFVPDSASTGKLTQMRAHGATVHPVPGPREASTTAAQNFVKERNVFYASHIFNPYFFEGTKTMAYELWEQLGYRAPDHLVLPVGHGTMFLGAYKGFRELHEAGLISSMPVFHAVQAEACAPVFEEIEKGNRRKKSDAAVVTCAEGIAITAPPRMHQIIDVLQATGGDVLTVNDEEIISAVTGLAALGFFVEPTAGAPFAAFKRLTRNNFGQAPGSPPPLVVVPLCGSGLKALKA